MLITALYLAEIIIVCVVAFCGFMFFRKKIGRKYSLILAAFILWLGVFSYFISDNFLQPINERLILTALGESDKKAEGTEIRINRITVDGKDVIFSRAAKGKWAWIKDNGVSLYSWREWDKGSTKTIEIDVPVGRVRTIEFQANIWRGDVLVKFNGISQLVHTYAANGAKAVTVPISATVENVMLRNTIRYSQCFFAIFLLLAFITYAVIFLLVRNSQMDNKLRKYNFLFDQLVKRDFTLKYKRTVLGMFWSVLSPLLNLLIMWLVFNELLGSNVKHFVIYLFAGQLVFSYFSDATTQGMTSLLENSSIFTKINVPKYMFLLSKNVSSLINFGLTLIIFFIFVAFEGLPFTWEFLMLFYPIGCLVVFNIGLGLILSALFVFFRDMQYIWGILTQLIMWLSAIFYSIESFPQVGQNLFLLNPIYLFIQYFRKIVINGTVPSLWFHLLIAGYTLIVLLLGCWMYKKNNHEFLYYI